MIILEGSKNYRTIHGMVKRAGKDMATGKVQALDRTDRDTRILSGKEMGMATGSAPADCVYRWKEGESAGRVPTL